MLKGDTAINKYLLYVKKKVCFELNYLVKCLNYQQCLLNTQLITFELLSIQNM